MLGEIERGSTGITRRHRQQRALIYGRGGGGGEGEEKLTTGRASSIIELRYLASGPAP
jgi:hypothetical protein